MIFGCPSIAELEALLVKGNKRVSRHAERCAVCQGILAMMLSREPSEPDDCAEIEILAAVRAAGDLSTADEACLTEHLESCPGCREVAAGELD